MIVYVKDSHIPAKDAAKEGRLTYSSKGLKVKEAVLDKDAIMGSLFCAASSGD